MWNNKIDKFLPKRKQNSHKGHYGKVLIVAGSCGMTGAAVLASRGAIRSGAGLTYLAVPKELVNLVDTITPEVITSPFDKINSINPDAIVIGPGMGVSRQTKKLLSSMTKHPSPLIIDADGLNSLAKDMGILKKADKKVIITPHPGEMARLTGKSIGLIQSYREKIARKFAAEYGCIVVLKGHKTIVADSFGKPYVNKSGNPGMASGGVGDVLVGIIASFIAQGIPNLQAAKLGVYIHGLAGDLAAKRKGQHGMIASDLVERIPYAIQQFN